MNQEMSQEAKKSTENVTVPAKDWRDELFAKVAPPAEPRKEETAKIESSRGYF